MLIVGTAQNGSRQAVVESGTISKSLSLIAFQPRIDEPSNPDPSLNIPSVSSSTGIEKCCQVPSRSTNFKSTICTLVFFANSTASRGFIPPLLIPTNAPELFLDYDTDPADTPSGASTGSPMNRS